MSPLVSVVIPVFNGARFLDETLRSVFAQDYSPIEVIVVDDGSTDDTPAVLARWGERVIVIRQANAGVASARNVGIRRATGAFVALQDADDLWAPDKLRLQVAHLAAHPEHGFVVAHVQTFLAAGFARPDWVSALQLAEPRVGGIGNMLVRAEVFAQVGLLDPKDPSDLDWSMRARESGVAAGVVPRVLLFRRVHDANLSGRVDGSKMRLAGLRAAIARKRAG